MKTRLNHHQRQANMRMPPMVAPTPIPAAAPVLSPDVSGWVGLTVPVAKTPLDVDRVFAAVE